MVSSIQFRNFRVLEQATLPLGAFNLLLGPNGSGKTTAVRALLAAGDTARATLAGQPLPLLPDLAGATAEFSFAASATPMATRLSFDASGRAVLTVADDDALRWLAGIRGFVLDPAALAQACPRGAAPTLASNGAGLPAVLAALRRADGPRWDDYVGEVRRLLPETTDVVAGETVNGDITFSVTKSGGQHLPPANLSQGTLVVLALLALAFAPDRPTLLCLEELERGLHPRLLRDVRDILYRLSFPQDAGESLPPVQVIATTHSPYVLDLFVDTPEDVVIAAKEEGGAAVFKRLVDVPELREMLQTGKLGDLWYSGILGGVP